MKRVDIEKDTDGHPLRTQHEHINQEESDEEPHDSDNEDEHETEHIEQQPDRPKHHYGRDIIIGLLVVIVFFTGASWYHSENQPAPQTSQPTVVHKTIVKNPPQNQNQQNQINDLQNKLAQLKMNGQQQANLINRFKQQKPAVQTKVYHYVQTIYKYVPIQPLKRKVVEVVANHNMRK